MGFDEKNARSPSQRTDVGMMDTYLNRLDSVLVAAADHVVDKFGLMERQNEGAWKEPTPHHLILASRIKLIGSGNGHQSFP